MRVLLGIVALLILAALGMAVWIYAGGYDASATARDPKAVEWITETARRQSVRVHARDIPVPQLADPILVEEGARTFAAHCTQCHAAPGMAPPRIAAAMQPSPPDLAQEVAEWTTPELFWIVRNGFKMTGMPAWGQILVDGEIWGVVAFLEQMPSMAPERYQQLVSPPPP
ncbi:MAG TPA: cytochrome c, partial [Candidatus Omnitrophota bacterium]|nr:cytochrome c [Candidatus Omnitrophota bacterium]